MRRVAARCGEWAQHFLNASCSWKTVHHFMEAKYAQFHGKFTESLCQIHRDFSALYRSLLQDV